MAVLSFRLVRNLAVGLFCCLSTPVCADNSTSAAAESVATPSPIPGQLLTQVAVPCNPPNQPPKLGLRSCSVVIPQMQATLKARMQMQVNGAPSPTPVSGIYQGCDHSSAVSGVCSDGQPGTTVPGNVCDPVAGIFNNNTAETTTNHLGQSCGEWAHPEAHLSGHTCYLSMNYAHPYHTAEEAWMRGAQVRGIECHLQQVTTELGNQALKLTNVGNTPSPCAAVFTQITQLQLSAAQQDAALKASLVSQPNVKETELCTGVQGASSDSNNPDVGALRQSACQLKATQQSLEANFTQMAACEVTTRLMYSYQSFLTSPDNGQTIDQAVMSIINGQQGNHTMCSVGYIQPKYNQYFQQRYFARMNAIWNDSVCSQ
ncbi:MAG: hypothetical protein P4M08_13785 [Oligoflexia bacterium]|nr:hypothetical protein [Oligoflexia bacterium]